MDYHSSFELESSLNVSVSLVDTLGYIVHSLRVPLNSLEASSTILLRSDDKNDHEFAVNLIPRVYNYFDSMLSKMEEFAEERIKKPASSNFIQYKYKDLYWMLETKEIDLVPADTSPEILLIELVHYLRVKNETLREYIVGLSQDNTFITSAQKIGELTAMLKHLLDILKSYLLSIS